jgi:tetratricopeptide (TPR) repeat protein/DNA-binding transcriptional regulator YbjK
MSIFVGRQDALDTFKQTIESLKPQNAVATITNWFSKKDTSKPKQIFLFDGEGGYGKTTLTNQCLKIANEVGKKNYKTIRLDFQEYYLKQVFTQKNSRTIISALYTHLTSDKLGIKDHFLKYEEVHQKIEAIEEKAKTAQKEEGETLTEQVADLASEGLTTLIDTKFAGVGTAFKGITKHLTKGFANQTEKAISKKWEKKLLREELDLYRNSDKILTDHLVEGLIEASKKHPIIIAFDNFEAVESTDIDSWLFTSLLKSIYQTEKTPNITFIITGRKDLYKDYKNAGLESDLCHNQTLKAFTQQEVQAFTQQHKLTLSEDQIKKLYKYTSGIPLVIEDAIKCLTEINPTAYNSFINDLRNSKGNTANIFKGLIDRFLRYCQNEPEKAQLYYLAFLHELDFNILSQVWNCTTQDAQQTLEQLTQKHSFIDSEGKLHAEVKKYLRQHLLKSPKLEPQAKTYTKALACAYLQKLETLKTQASISEYYQDENFIKNLLRYFLMLLYKHPEEAFTLLPVYLLEMLEFNIDLAVTLFSVPLSMQDEAGKEKTFRNHGILHQFETTLQERYKQETDLYQKAILIHFPIRAYRENKQARTGTEKELQPFKKYLDKLTNNAHYQLSPLQTQLLKLKQSEYYAITKQADKAFQYLSQIEPFEQNTLNIATGFYFLCTGILYEDEKRIPEAINAYEKALEKEEWSAYNNLGSLYKDYFKDYTKAENYYLESIEKEEWGAYNNLGILYEDYLKDYLKAEEYYQKAVKKEVWEAYGNLGDLYRNHFDNYPKAEEYYQQAIEKEIWGAYGNLGNLYMICLKDYPKAEEYYLKALKKEIWLAYASLGILYQKYFKNPQKAEENYQKALDEKAWYAYIGLSNLYFYEKNNPQKALKVGTKGIKKIQTLLEKEPKNEDYHAILAVLYALSEDKEAFYAYLTKAVEYGYELAEDIDLYPQSVQRYFPEEAFQALIKKSREPLV